MDVNDYLIDSSGFEWATLLGSWAWVLPGQVTVWLVNRFGDLFVIGEDGTVRMLDLGLGTLTTLAA